MNHKILMLAGAAVFMTALNAEAAIHAATSTQNTKCTIFVDEDEDGICDNCGIGFGFIDEDGDGICDNWNINTGRGCGIGFGFIDEDGDGICDNCGIGLGFIDEDGDGICDNWNINASQRRGYGRGKGYRRNCRR